MDFAPAQNLHKNMGPVHSTSGPVPLTSVQKGLPGPQVPLEVTDEESMERIPHYLKGKCI